MRRFLVQFSALLVVLFAPFSSALTPVWESYAPQLGVATSEAAKQWLASGDRIYVVGTHSLVAMQTSSGAVQWTREIGPDPTLSLLSDGGVAVLTGGRDGVPCVLDRYGPAGELVWSKVLPLGATMAVLLPTPMPANAIVVHYDGWSGGVITLELDGSERWRGRIGVDSPGCIVGVAGTIACVGNWDVRVFGASDGHFERCPIEAIYDRWSSYRLAAQADGSITCYSNAPGGSAYVYSAEARLLRKRTQTSSRSSWFPRQDGGMVTYEPSLDELTTRVTAISADDRIEWMREGVPLFPPFVYGANGAAVGNTTYIDNIAIDASGWTRLPVSLTGKYVVTAGPDGLLQGGSMPGTFLRPDGTVVWSNLPTVLADNGYSAPCEPNFTAASGSILAPRYTLQPPNAPRGDVIDRATGSVLSVTMPPDVAVYRPDVKQLRVARDAAGHFFVIWSTGTYGNVLWTLREYAADFTLIRESAPNAEVWVSPTVPPEVVVGEDGGKWVLLNSSIIKFDKALGRQSTYTLDSPTPSDCHALWHTPDGTGMIVRNGTYRPMTLARLDAQGDPVWNMKPAEFFARAVAFGESDSVFVVHWSQTGEAVSKINAEGNVLWTANTSLAGSPPETVEFTAIAARPGGGVVAVGRRGFTNTEVAIAAGFDAAGREEFAVVLDAAGSNPTRATSVVTVPNGQMVIATMQQRWPETSGTTQHWETATLLLDKTGNTRALWVDIDRYQRRTYGGWTLQTVEPDGDVIQVGRFSPPGTYHMTTNARRVNLVDRDLRLAVSAPVGSFQVGAPMLFQITLRDSAGSLVPSVEALDVWAEKTRSAFAPFKACTIAPGSSSCVATIRADLPYATTFSFFADGTLPARSVPMDIVQPVLSVATTYVQPGPYRTFTPIIVEYEVRGGFMAAGESVQLTNDYFELAIYASVPGTSCERITAATTLPARFRCVIPLSSSPSLTITARPTSTTLPYATTNQVTTTVTSIAKSTPTIAVEEIWPRDPAPLGATLSPIVPLQVNGVRTTRQVGGASMTLTLGASSCVAQPIYIDPPANSMETGRYTCALQLSELGTWPLMVSYAGSNLLNPAAASSPETVNVQAMPGFFVDHPHRYTLVDVGGSVCSTTAGLTCQNSPDGTRTMCTAAPGWRGPLFVQPLPALYGFRRSGPPPMLGPLNSFLGNIAIDNIVIPLPSSCGPDLDLDRDGYVNASTDGLLLLRAMLGFRGSSLVNEAVNGCGMRLSADDIASVVAQYARSNTVNADGVGQPPASFATTDALLFLRYMLGLRGSALVAGAVDLTRGYYSASAIEQYLARACY